jgi:hypothetical protein
VPIQRYRFITVKALRILAVAALCLSSCARAGAPVEFVETPTTQDLAMTAETEPPVATVPVTDVETADPPSGICAVFDAHLDDLLVNLEEEPFRGLFTGEVDPDDPLLGENDGPFGEAWHALMTDLVERDRSDKRPLIDTEQELVELNQLSAAQCGYPILSAIATMTCAPDSGGEPTCEEPTDTRAEYRRFQQTADRIEAYFEAGGPNWLSEIPGEGIAAMRSYDASGETLVRIEALVRIDEDQVPELGLWVAGFSEFNNFDFDNLDSLRDPLFWDQADHRATYLSMAVVGGLFGV